MLYSRLPSSIAAALIGVFLCCLILFESVGLETLKPWVGYMLTVAAVRVWIWYMFGKADLRADGVGRWEWLFAAGALLTGLGWGALFGPIHPPPAHADAQTLVALVAVITVFVGAVFFAVSHVSFWLFVVPALTPAIVHFASAAGTNSYWPVAGSACCVVVLLIVQRTLYSSAARQLKRGAEADVVLAEQQAIFDSSPTGIAVLDGRHILKCNMRLGELLGRRILDLTNSNIDQHFFSKDEATQFLADSTAAFERRQSAQGMYRLRRADGTQFWAEFSGRRMTDGSTHSVWIIADVTLRVADTQRARPQEPE